MKKKLVISANWLNFVRLNIFVMKYILNGVYYYEVFYLSRYILYLCNFYYYYIIYVCRYGFMLLHFEVYNFLLLITENWARTDSIDIFWHMMSAKAIIVHQPVINFYIVHTVALVWWIIF